jgi:hypothetical protein
MFAEGRWISEFADGTGEVEWHPREEPTAVGKIWATDEKTVWLIWGDGKPIPEYATSVKAWTVALIPKAPKL